MLLALGPHDVHVRIVPVLLLLSYAGCTAPSRAGNAFGIWKLNPARSTDRQPDDLIVRFESHPKGEVFTLDRIARDNRVTTSSTILYFDGKPRNFQDLGCSGTQSSRRLDSVAIEIQRMCSSGAWMRFVRRLASRPNELILEITEQQPDGRSFERCLVLEKQ